MIITPLEPLTLEMLDGSFQPMGTDRPSGEHLSECIKRMKEAAKLSVSPIAGEEDSIVRPQLGFLWERAALLVQAGMSMPDAMELLWKDYMRVQNKLSQIQPRLCLDGIHMTPDGFNPHLSMLDSYKLTWRSMGKWNEDVEEHFWPWLVAEKAYLWAYTMQLGIDILTCRFYICWVNGDYTKKPGHGPQATQCDMICTRQELEDNWKSVLLYRSSE